jgi:hypothetical protein
MPDLRVSMLPVGYRGIWQGALHGLSGLTDLSSHPERAEMRCFAQADRCREILLSLLRSPAEGRPSVTLQAIQALLRWQQPQAGLCLSPHVLPGIEHGVVTPLKPGLHLIVIMLAAWLARLARHQQPP